MVPTRERSPYVPLQPHEIVRDVLDAANIGITMVHLHAYETDGRPTYKKEFYARIIAGIREHRQDLIICVSCSGRYFREFDQRADVLSLSGDLRPDMASLTLSSLNFSRQVSINEPQIIQCLAKRMLESGIIPEFEIFDLGMANYAKYLIEKLNLHPPHYANIILGNVATAQADLLSIAALSNALPFGTIWGLGGVGNAQIPVTALAATIAPAVRVGLEDNLWLDKNRTRPVSNCTMVERIHHLAMLTDRTVMPSEELRALLRLNCTHGNSLAA